MQAATPGSTYPRATPNFWSASAEGAAESVLYPALISFSEDATDARCPLLALFKPAVPDADALSSLPRPVNFTPLAPLHLSRDQLAAVHTYTLRVILTTTNSESDTRRAAITQGSAPYHLTPMSPSWELASGSGIIGGHMQGTEGLVDWVRVMSPEQLDDETRSSVAYGMRYLNQLLLVRQHDSKLPYAPGESLSLQALTSREANPDYNLESLELMGDASMEFKRCVAAFHATSTTPSIFFVINVELRHLSKEAGLPSYLAHDTQSFAASSWGDEYVTQAGVSTLSHFIPNKGVGDLMEAHFAAVLKSSGQGAAFEALKQMGVSLPVDETWEEMHAAILGELSNLATSDAEPSPVRVFIEAKAGQPLANPKTSDNVIRCGKAKVWKTLGFVAFKILFVRNRTTSNVFGARSYSRSLIHRYFRVSQRHR
ncbi:hypothetical protein BOTBODRAFT_567374 [Botryobasidium botryosum FD-172 SS1]|uniref:RNase III domain-containing protein n=1 Tax=Botryobasidium botryosum (strain FD-172 SS1) TaxID=930990 RepID=A0A067LYR0_BOTB1|nr:hypothetical protein BOTBODRAFT_567374 [Botryobasidium botryosum FD-172 SS1]